LEEIGVYQKSDGSTDGSPPVGIGEGIDSKAFRIVAVSAGYD
jgi:hypothetical protein